MTISSELKAIAAVQDPHERAARLTAYITEADKALTTARGMRDDIIKQLRGDGLSQPKIADVVGVSLSTVKAVLR